MKYRCLDCQYVSEDHDHLFWIREWKTQAGILIILCVNCVDKIETRIICDQFSKGDHV